jgi:hypothetical protein
MKVRRPILFVRTMIGGANPPNTVRKRTGACLPRIRRCECNPKLVSSYAFKTRLREEDSKQVSSYVRQYQIGNEP